jgi:hypothetical protein
MTYSPYVQAAWTPAYPYYSNYGSSQPALGYTSPERPYWQAGYTQTPPQETREPAPRAAEDYYRAYYNYYYPNYTAMYGPQPPQNASAPELPPQETTLVEEPPKKAAPSTIIEKISDLKNKEAFEQLTAVNKEPVAPPQSRLAKYMQKFGHVDFWKDSSARYMGYANDMFDCWEEVVKHKNVLGPKIGHRMFVTALTASWIYVLSDAVTNAMKTYKRSEGYPLKSRVIFGLAITGDTILFQALASHLVPLAVVRGLHYMARKALEKLPLLSRLAPKTGMAYVIIPALVSSSVVFMIRHIDTMVKKFVDIAYWSWMNKLLKKSHAPEAPVIVTTQDLRLPMMPHRKLFSR